MASEFNDLRRELISLHNRHYSGLQQSIEKLHGVLRTFEGEFRNATECSRYGSMAGITGGAVMIAGVALAPFTLGFSSALTVTGLAVSVGGAVGGGAFNIQKIQQQRTLRKTVEAELKTFELTITPITDILTQMNQHTAEMLRNVDLSQYDVNILSKLFANGSELVRIVRLDDIGELAAQMSKTVRVATTLSGIFAGIGLVLDILSFLEDDKALSDMDKLAGTQAPISETEMKSKAGTFIITMRKVISDLENIMAEIKKTINKLSNPQDTH